MMKQGQETGGQQRQMAGQGRREAGGDEGQSP
jgi:hypothetical protein